jgi:hypothetical protein
MDDSRWLSALMIEYNHCKRGLDSPKRSDRALALIMSGRMEEKIEQYNTTLTSCECPDMEYRGGYCYHRRALMILHRMHKPRNGICHCAFTDTKFNGERWIRVCADCGKEVT